MVVDQGTGIVHIYDDRLEERAKLDLTPYGMRVPHMIDFTPDGAHALIAKTVRPNGRQAIVAVIGSPQVERDGFMIFIRIDP